MSDEATLKFVTETLRKSLEKFVWQSGGAAVAALRAWLGLHGCRLEDTGAVYDESGKHVAWVDMSTVHFKGDQLYAAIQPLQPLEYISVEIKIEEGENHGPPAGGQEPPGGDG